jgi:RNA recognition motif-containing protein
VITKIYIGGIPADMDEMELAQLVSLYGNIHTLKIVFDRQTRKPKGFAFVEMASREAAENVVIALDGAEMRGKNLAINICEEKPVMPPLHYKKVQRNNAPKKKKRPRIQR